MALGNIIENLQPSSSKQLYQGNYIDFTDGNFEQWGQQFLPDVYEKEAEIYGNRTIGGFLKMVSAELPMSADQVIWTEQGRLHTRYVALRGTTSVPSDLNAAVTGNDLSGVDAGDEIAFGFASISGDKGQPTAGSVSGGGGTNGQASQAINVTLRVGQTVMIAQQDGTDVSATTGATVKGIVTGVGTAAFSVRVYEDFAGSSSATASYTALAFGNEFGKGSGNFTEKIDPQYSTYSNSPIIMKEHYSIYGSDATQIGWIEVTSENGASGYLWYVKAEHENRLRWEDQQEMTMLEAVDYAGSTSHAFPNINREGSQGVAPTASNIKGTEGFFQALNDRGNNYEGLVDDLAVGGRNGLAAFDNILKTLDKNGAIEENMLYVNRDLALEFDNLLASQSDYTQNGGGASWGVFNNSSSMALDLGFTGFRRGSYDFYKTDWKYLNDFSTRGGFSDIEGVMIPAGVSTVYDQTLGKNIKRPFLHVRYRASETENRKNKSWITGSVGGAYTTDIDELRLHYLTERCLVTQGANNFFKFNG